jgi:hypothetical protein
MWPKDILEGGPRGVMDVVRSKVFVVQQVPDRWGDLNPVVCTKCRNVQATPWWRCVDCPDHDVVCVSCRGKGESVFYTVNALNYDDFYAEDKEEEEEEEEGQDGGQADVEVEREEGAEPNPQHQEEDSRGHNDTHTMQLVVDNQQCAWCHEHPVRCTPCSSLCMWTGGRCSWLGGLSKARGGCGVAQVVLPDLSRTWLLLWLV